jgi:hypothetical protein
MAQCEDCATTEMFSTQLQRERWVLKGHIGHTIWTWRVATGKRQSSVGKE